MEDVVLKVRGSVGKNDVSGCHTPGSRKVPTRLGGERALRGERREGGEVLVGDGYES